MTAPNSPPNPVVEAGSFECRDQGIRKLEGLSSGGTTIRLSVNDSPVVTVKAAPGTGTYTGCAFSDSNGNHQCNSTTISTPGASKLTVGDSAVLLSSDSVSTVNLVAAGSGKATVQAGQTKLTAT
jgi:hypothetical protein